MCAYSTDRTHIRVCSIVVFFAEFDRGVFCGCSWGGFPTGIHEQKPGIHERKYLPALSWKDILVEKCCNFAIGLVG